jgi:hypothetical protein
MRFPIRPGKLSCAGIVIIMMVLPNSIWRGPDAKIPPPKLPQLVSGFGRASRLHGNAWSSYRGAPHSHTLPQSNLERRSDSSGPGVVKKNSIVAAASNVATRPAVTPP